MIIKPALSIVSESADALCDALKAEPNAVIRLDAYTLDAGKVTPVRITLLDADGDEIFVSDFPAEGSVIRESNCSIKNQAETGNQNHCDKQRPAGRCCFYCRFVCFNVILLHYMKNSHIYQCKAALKQRQTAFQDMKDASLTLPADSDIIELPERR